MNNRKEEEVMPFYYLCSYPLGPESVIQKGNWGRIMRLNLINQNSALYLIRELAFERIRIEEFPDRPSRFKSVFLCPSIESVREFKKERPSFDIIYEIMPLDASANSFEADWSLIKNPVNKNIMQVEEEARNYWSGLITSDDKKETVIESDIKIVRKLED
jgi:hypothetical protein